MYTVQDLAHEVHISEISVGSSFVVDVTYIKNPHSFYVRPPSYNMYLDAIHHRGERMRDYEVEVGNIVIYKSNKMDSYLRGEVLSIINRGVLYEDSEAEYKLFALDVGFTEPFIPISRLWRQSYEWVLPPLATLCRLANCAPLAEKWDSNAINAMRACLEGQQVKMVIRSETNEYLTVDLYTSGPDHIAKQLAHANYMKYGDIDPSIVQQMSEINLTS